MTQLVLGWWIGPASGLLARPLEGAVRPRLVVIGETLRVKPPIKVCERGLHASRRLLDALYYAQESTLCIYRVECGGEIDEQSDKLAAETRTAPAVMDAETSERELRLFACDAAEYALAVIRKRGEEPDPRSVAAIAVARNYATGAATKRELAAFGEAAREAAWAAFGEVAGDVAWAAAKATEVAGATAWAAAQAAEVAQVAAQAAAGDAARDAAWNAARDAAWNDLNGMLERRILGLMELPSPAVETKEAARA